MLRIEIETVPVLRYDSLGDYFLNGAGTHRIETQEMGNDVYSFLIGLHELVESYLCKTRGISFDKVDEWDIQTYKGKGEPGDDPDCPYHKEHVFATKIEKIVCKEMGIDWDSYNDFLAKFNIKENEHE